jgi:uncharacterized membrane protein YccC
MAAAAAVVGLGSYTAATTDRSLQRFVGSTIGVFVAVALVALRPMGLPLAIVLASLVLASEYTVITNYALAIVFVTPLALVLTNAATHAESADLLLRSRLSETLVGCVCGVIAGRLVTRHWAFRQLVQSLFDAANQLEVVMLASACGADAHAARKLLEVRLERLVRINQRTSAESKRIRQAVEPLDPVVKTFLCLARTIEDRIDAGACGSVSGRTLPRAV